MGFFESGSTQLVGGDQRNLRRQKITPFMRELFDSMPKELLLDFPSFEGPEFGLQPIEQLSLTGLERIAAGDTSGMAGGRLQQSSEAALQDILGRTPGSEEFEDFFSTNIADPLMEFFREETLPAIRSEGIRSGNLFGSATDERMARADEALLETVGRERARSVFENDAMRMQAMELAPQIAALTGVDAGVLTQLLATGGLPRDIELMRHNLTMDEMIRRLSLILGTAFNQTRSGTIGTGPGTQMLQQLGASSGQIVSTAIGSTSKTDASGASASGLAAFCWVAAAYFGWFTPEWWATRNFLLHRWRGPNAEVFRRIYTTCGERMASSSYMLRVLEPFFLRARALGEGK